MQYIAMIILPFAGAIIFQSGLNYKHKFLSDKEIDDTLTNIEKVTNEKLAENDTQ